MAGTSNKMKLIKFDSDSIQSPSGGLDFCTIWRMQHENIRMLLHLTSMSDTILQYCCHLAKQISAEK